MLVVKQGAGTIIKGVIGRACLQVLSLRELAADVAVHGVVSRLKLLCSLMHRYMSAANPLGKRQVIKVSERREGEVVHVVVAVFAVALGTKGVVVHVFGTHNMK